jgi:filamentous hemagglutinin family protein
MRRYKKRTGRVGVSAIISAASVIAGSVDANPAGEQVTAGSASFDRSQAGQLLIHQGTSSAIIDWTSFSIGSGEITQFIQPSEASSVLNRVTGADPSAIYGTLRSNGKVFLINPHGILVGSSGVVDTHGFVASTLNVKNEAFLAGKDLSLSGASGASVRNEGKISASSGDVFLVARSVQNTGLIQAPQGTVGVGAGQEVVIKTAGDRRLTIAPKSGSEAASGTGVDLHGRVEAVTAEIRAAGGNVYALAINLDGLIQTRASGAAQASVAVSSEGGDGSCCRRAIGEERRQRWCYLSRRWEKCEE